MSASPSLSHMTSFYITAVSSAENEERPRMRIKRRKKRKKTQPERHGPVQQQQQQHSVPITKRERERSRAEREATSLPFPSSISTDRPRTRVGATQVHSDCPPVSRVPPLHHLLLKMSVGSDFGNPLRKFKLVFLGEQSGKTCLNSPEKFFFFFFLSSCRVVVVNPLHLLASQQVHPVEETDI